MKNKIAGRQASRAGRILRKIIGKELWLHVHPHVQNLVRWPAQDRADLIWEPILDEIWVRQDEIW